MINISGKKFVRIFATKKEWRGMLNSLIGKNVVFIRPLKDIKDIGNDKVRCAGEVVDFTDDLRQVLLVEKSTGKLYMVPIEEIIVLSE